MFTPGSKIAVIESSCERRLGPKKGSIGYVTSSRNVVIYPMKNYVVTAAEVGVYFTRYGFERKERQERKTIVALLPLKKVLPAEKEGLRAACVDAVERTKYFIRDRSALDSLFKFKGSHGSNRLVDMLCTGRKTPVVVAAPVSCAGDNPVTMTDIEFSAWLSSHIFNKAFSTFIMEALLERGRLRKNCDIDSEVLVEMLACNGSKRRRDRLVAGILSGPIAGRQNIVEVVKCIELVNNTWWSKKAVIHSPVPIAVRLGCPVSEFYRTTFWKRSLFSSQEALNILLTKATKSSPKYIGSAYYLTTLRSTLCELSDKLSKGG